MDRIIPSQDDIFSALTKVFRDTVEASPLGILNALVPIDMGFAPGYPVLTYLVDQEMQEVCEFVNDLNLYAAKEDLTNSQRMRAKILVYCHILETHLPFMVLWNLLQILSRQPCTWKFYIITKKGNRQICILPREKIAAISGLSENLFQPIGKVMKGLWQPDLRNSFTHSQYIIESDNILITNQLSPISRREKKPINPITHYSFDEIEQLYLAANQFFTTFISSYKSVIGPFKDGRQHRIDTGFIEWNPRGRWIWGKTK